MKMENTNKKLTEEIQEEKDLILDKALDEMWERGFKYGVAWLLKQTEEDGNTEKIDSILGALEGESILKGSTQIYYSLED